MKSADFRVHTLGLPRQERIDENRLRDQLLDRLRSEVACYLANVRDPTQPWNKAHEWRQTLECTLQDIRTQESQLIRQLRQIPRLRTVDDTDPEIPAIPDPRQAGASSLLSFRSMVGSFIDRLRRHSL